MACNGARICPISCLPCLPECAMLRTAHRYRFLDGEGVMTSEVAGYYCGASGRPESDGLGAPTTSSTPMVTATIT